MESAAPAGSGDEKLLGTFGPMAAPAGAPGNDPGLAATAAPAPGATGAPAPAPTVAPSGDRAGLAGEAATTEPTLERVGVTGTSDGDPESGNAVGRDAEPTVPVAALISLALLAAGLALLVGRMVARRRFA